MTRTCAEQGRKQAPSAKKNEVKAVAAAKWQRTDVKYAYTTTDRCLETPHRTHAAVYCYIYKDFNEMPPRDPGGAVVREIGKLRPCAARGEAGGRHRLSEKPGR